MQRLQKIFRYVFRGVTSVFGGVLFVIWFVTSALKAVVDWIGRSTFADDATQLGKKLNAVGHWLLEQPSLLFYGTALGLGIIGSLLIFAPVLPIRKFLENRVYPQAWSKKQLATRTASPINFVFLRDQDDDKSGKQNRSFIGIFEEGGGPIVAMRVVWKIGIKNTCSDKTIKNTMVCVTLRDGRSFPIRCSDIENGFYADIHPYRTAYFDIGFFTIVPPNDTNIIIDSAQLVPKIVADRIKSQKSISLSFFPTKNAAFAPVENVDKSTINVDVYADDVQPIHATIMCCLEDNPRMFMI